MTGALILSGTERDLICFPQHHDTNVNKRDVDERVVQCISQVAENVAAGAALSSCQPQPQPLPSFSNIAFTAPHSTNQYIR